MACSVMMAWLLPPALGFHPAPLRTGPVFNVISPNRRFWRFVVLKGDFVEVVVCPGPTAAVRPLGPSPSARGASHLSARFWRASRLGRRRRARACATFEL